MELTQWTKTEHSCSHPVEIVRLRASLENKSKNGFHWNTSFYHSGFPKGCCGDSTDLLALHMKLKFNKCSSYCLGQGLKRNKSISHAWLMLDGYIIDITADQFNDLGYTNDPVIIEKHSEFHSLFHKTTINEIDTDKLVGTPIHHVLNSTLKPI